MSRPQKIANMYEEVPVEGENRETPKDSPAKKGNKKKASGTGKTRADSYKWPGDLEHTFAEAYQEFPCLWNTLDPGYAERDTRQAALEKLAETQKMSGNYHVLIMCHHVSVVVFNLFNNFSVLG